jgi:hypothetical protein
MSKKCYLCNPDAPDPHVFCDDCNRGFDILGEHGFTFRELVSTNEMPTLRDLIRSELDLESVEFSYVALMYVVIHRKVKFAPVH